MSWIKLSDKHPNFETLVELTTEKGSIQARLLSIDSNGFTFDIYYADKTVKETIAHASGTQWQDKPALPGKEMPATKKRTRVPKPKADPDSGFLLDTKPKVTVHENVHRTN